MAHESAKLLAAQRALSFVKDGMAVGLGTGSTATLFIRELGKSVQDGLNVRCIASSQASHDLAQSLGITVVDFSTCDHLDLAVDGADEIAPGLALIKGGGGALLREKIVISAASQFIVVADASKVSETLGTFPLPVEVIQMASPIVSRKLKELRLIPLQRMIAPGQPYITDEGNFILDCQPGPITNPPLLADQLRQIVGVVEHGLFLNMATLAIVADGDNITERST